jgi:hypothetical protein
MALIKFRSRKPKNKRSQVISYNYYRSSVSTQSSHKNNNQSSRIARLPAIPRLGSKSAGFKKRPSLTTLAIALFVLVCTGLLLMVNPTPVVIVNESLNNTPVSYRDKADYQKKAKDLISAEFLGRTKITFPSQKIKQQMKNTFPEIDDIEIAMPIVDRRPVIGISLKQPALVINSVNKRYVVSRDGLVLGSDDQLASSIFDGLSEVIYRGQSINSSVGKVVIGMNDFELIKLLEDNLKAPRAAIQSIEFIPQSSDYELKLVSSNYVVKLNSIQTPHLQVGSLMAILNEIEQGKTAPPSSYIDVRVAERIFIK